MATTVDTKVTQQSQEMENQSTNDNGSNAVPHEHVGKSADVQMKSDAAASEERNTAKEMPNGGSKSAAQLMPTKSIFEDGNKNAASTEADGGKINTVLLHTTTSPNNMIDANNSWSALLQVVTSTLSRLQSDISLLEDLKGLIEQKVGLFDPSTTEDWRKLDKSKISVIFASEREIMGKGLPVKGGPTAQAQKHLDEEISGKSIRVVSVGEEHVSGHDGIAKGEPAAILQQKFSKSQADESRSANFDLH